MRRPPRPPLFPYTTLFRSGLGRGGDGERCAVGTGGCGRHGVSAPQKSSGVRREPAPTRLPTCESESAPDRKSTRLNSSHVEISYAVFCLKKNIEWIGCWLHPARLRGAPTFLVADAAATETATLSLHDALPIWSRPWWRRRAMRGRYGRLWATWCERSSKIFRRSS